MMDKNVFSLIGLLVFLIYFSLSCSSNTTAEDSGVKEFKKVSGEQWEQVFYDLGTNEWTENWMLDGLKATVTNTNEGMVFQAGPTVRDDSSNAVLWTKESFEGDVKIEYEYTRLDSATRFVTIFYIQATGSGEGPYNTDISEWNHLRTVPAMRTYFNNMNIYHISYAAFPGPESDYIRARRYLPLSGKGLKGTALEPDYKNTGLFKTGVPHKITVIKKDNDLFMYVRNQQKDLLCHWKTDTFPEIKKGRIGLRHMHTRKARYRDFRISLMRNNATGMKLMNIEGELTHVSIQ